LVEKEAPSLIHCNNSGEKIVGRERMFHVLKNEGESRKREDNSKRGDMR
jgi:hypothetical protein